jgi:bacterioferritin-associated ferredoxin
VIVCHCRVVTDRQVAEAVHDGARSLAAVCRATGASQDCGACVFSLKRLVLEEQEARVPMTAHPAAGLSGLSTFSSLSGVDVAAG